MVVGIVIWFLMGVIALVWAMRDDPRSRYVDLSDIIVVILLGPISLIIMISEMGIGRKIVQWLYDKVNRGRDKDERK